MESDESIDFVDSEAVNPYGSVLTKEERENPCEHFEEGENVDPPRFHSFINFFNWSLPPLVNRTKGQLKFHVRAGGGACARKSGRGCCPCKAANNNCKASCQCRWRSFNDVTKRPAAGHGLKITKCLAVWYFSVFLFEIYKIFIRKLSTFIYNPQALPGSQKFRTWCFSLTLQPSKRVTRRNVSLTRPDTVLK